MSAAIESRLRKLEAARPLSVPVYVWCDAETDRAARVSEMLASGRASEGDEFVFIGWLGAHECENDVKQTGAL